MHILAIHDATTIKIWLAGEPVESAEAHIRNGYPQMLSNWQAGALTAEVVEVPEAETFRPDLYEVAGGTVRRKA